jgi:hypothetical protein
MNSIRSEQEYRQESNDWVPGDLFIAEDGTVQTVTWVQHELLVGASRFGSKPYTPAHTPDLRDNSHLLYIRILVILSWLFSIFLNF